MRKKALVLLAALALGLAFPAATLGWTGNTRVTVYEDTYLEGDHFTFYKALDGDINDLGNYSGGIHSDSDCAWLDAQYNLHYDWDQCVSSVDIFVEAGHCAAGYTGYSGNGTRLWFVSGRDHSTIVSWNDYYNDTLSSIRFGNYVNGNPACQNL